MSMTYLGVTVGGGMIHFVLLPDNGESAGLDHRVIEVDEYDGLANSERLSSGIDLMIEAARQRGDSVGSIGVAHSSTHAGDLSGGAGTRRQVVLCDDSVAASEWLIGTGEVGQYDSVLVADCGDTGMSTYRLDPRTGEVAMAERHAMLSGSAIDQQLTESFLARGQVDLSVDTATLLSAVRTAKEHLSEGVPVQVHLPSVGGRVELTAGEVEHAVAPMARSAARAIAARADVGVDAIVLIGGVANIPAVSAAIREATAVPVIVATNPEFVMAAGAAMLVRERIGSSAGVTFIGGKRSRAMTLVPFAIAGAMAFGAVATAYAIGTSISTPEKRTSSVIDQSSSHTEATTSALTRATSTVARPAASHIPTSTETIVDAPPVQELPSWETTQIYGRNDGRAVPTTTLVALPTLPSTTPKVPPTTTVVSVPSSTATSGSSSTAVTGSPSGSATTQASGTATTPNVSGDNPPNSLPESATIPPEEPSSTPTSN